MNDNVRAKRIGLFLTAIGLWASVCAEPLYVPPNRSATPGAQQKTKLLALRVVGSTVKNPQGEYLGRIEEAAINPNTGQIEFAMLQIYYPTNTSRITPVPWKVLNYVSDQSQNGGLPGAVQTFSLSMSRSQLERAPTLDRSRWPNLNEPYWAERIYAYYGVRPESGLAMSPGTGEATPEPLPEEEFGPPLVYEPGPYVAAAAGLAASIIPTNLPPATNVPPFTPIPAGATNQLFNTNVFLNRTNFFLNRTNFFPGTRTPFNSDDPSTFPRSVGMKTNSTPSMVVTNNPASPFNPPFTAGDTPALPPPVAANSPWSPQFGNSQPSPQLPVQPQPSPWSPRFLPPDTQPQPIQPQPNPWSPRFVNPATDPSGSTFPPAMAGAPSGGGSSSPGSAWGSGPPAMAAPAPGGSAWNSGPIWTPPPPRAPAVRVAPTGRR